MQQQIFQMQQQQIQYEMMDCEKLLQAMAQNPNI